MTIFNNNNGADYSKAENGIMIQHADESDDSRDSDAKQMFKLPRRKVVRPPSTALRNKIGYGNNW